MQISTAPFLGFTGSDKKKYYCFFKGRKSFVETLFLGKEEKMKILEEIKENLAEGKRSPMEEIYETSLLPPTDIRKTSIGIILDLIRTEKETDENNEENITKLERDFLDSIVWLFTKGKGDVKYVLLVNQILSEWVQKKLNDQPEGHQFVSRLTGAMKLLLDYRDCGENRVAQIAGLVNLAQFFFRCSRVDLYRDYLYKLYDVQLGVNSRLEAANCLR
ncbi:unnamed protein product [Oikopleura dioica]|uniref:Uncharacterized protein n=1 Tax=Oikopleura dioica TaxID=34765 RepID=E4X5R4_OIKDI|nr:unnamed protein product [Oikopleura dioica]